MAFVYIAGCSPDIRREFAGNSPAQRRKSMSKSDLLYIFSLSRLSVCSRQTRQKPRSSTMSGKASGMGMIEMEDDQDEGDVTWRSMNKKDE